MAAHVERLTREAAVVCWAGMEGPITMSEHLVVEHDI